MTPLVIAAFAILLNEQIRSPANVPPRDPALHSDDTSGQKHASTARSQKSQSPSEAHVSGTVRESGTNRPVEGIKVRVIRSGHAPDSVVSKTRSDGTFDVAVRRDPEWQTIDVVLSDWGEYQATVAREGIPRDGSSPLSLEIERSINVAVEDLSRALDGLSAVAKLRLESEGVEASLSALRQLHPTEFTQNAAVKMKADTVAAQIDQRQLRFADPTASAMASKSGVTLSTFPLSVFRPGISQDSGVLVPPDATAGGDRLNAAHTGPLVGRTAFESVTNRTARIFSSWTGTGYYSAGPDALVASSHYQECCEERRSTFEHVRLDDVGLSGGGPLLPDRVWLFGQYGFTQDRESQPGADPVFPRHTAAHVASASLTWQITDDVTISSKYAFRFWKADEQPTVAAPFHTLLTWTGRNRAPTFVKVDYVLNASTVVSGRIADTKSPETTATPHSTNINDPWMYDVVSGYSRGGAYGSGTFRSAVRFLESSARHFGRSFGMSHDVVVRTAASINHEERTWRVPTDRLLYLGNDGPISENLVAPSRSRARVRGLSLAAEDTVRIGSRLTVSAGLRYFAITSSTVHLSADRGQTIEGTSGQRIGKLFNWRMFAPSAGISGDITGRGNVFVAAAWQKNPPGLSATELLAVHPGDAKETATVFDTSTTSARQVTIIDTARQVVVDSFAKPPSSYSASADVSGSWRWDTVWRVSVFRRHTRGLTGWTEIAGNYELVPMALPGGRNINLLALRTPTEDRKYLFTSLPNHFEKLTALSVSGHKDWKNGNFVEVVYRLSSHTGLTNSSAEIDAPSQLNFERLTRFGQDPNLVTNARGDLLDDRRHQFIVNGTAIVPRIATRLGIELRHQTGRPFSPFIDVVLPQGLTEVLITPRGVHRFPSDTQIDVTVSKTMGTRRRKLRLDGELLNLFNSSTPVEYVTGDVKSTNFQKPSKFVRPRRALVGLSVLF